MVVGAGVAGLTYAIKVATAFPDRRVVVLNKCAELMSNTRMAQGGIAVVTDTQTDSFQKHVNDTLKAGDGLCDEQVVRTIIGEGPERVQEVIDWGVRFDAQNGKLLLGREGGHVENRVVHKGDQTGLELAEVLLRKVQGLPNVHFVSGHMAYDLVMADGVCIGARVIDSDGNDYSVLSSVTVLATGGSGQVYGFTTNPSIATGDGLAMAHQAGVNISNMEFIQFHPTALYHPKMTEPFLISEAIRGAGARLLNTAGDYFMKSYDAQADLAPRDVVSRAVFNEMQKTQSDHVLLDCSWIDPNELSSHFPTISQKCAALGLAIQTDHIPVRPSAHYCCGGIDTDLDGNTNISRLYAIGECANTGLHGANRLASNSLLEALVMAHRCFLATEHIAVVDTTDESMRLPSLHNAGVDVRALRKNLGELMDTHVGIIRTELGLKHALQEIKRMSSVLGAVSASDGTDFMELRNLLIVAELIVTQSLNRKKNVGGFYRSDLE